MGHVSACVHQQVAHLWITPALTEVGADGRTALHSLTLRVSLPACSSQVHYMCLGEFSRSVLCSPRFTAGIVGQFACCRNSSFPGSGLGCGKTAQCSLISVCCGLPSALQGVRGCFILQIAFLAKQTSSSSTISLMPKRKRKMTAITERQSMLLDRV